MNIDEFSKTLKSASSKLALHNANQKNIALKEVAKSIDKYRNEIIEANKIDLQNSKEKGMSDALLERLMLDQKRIDGILDSMKIVISQSDPIGEIVAGWNTPNGMSIKQIRVPLGVISVIYESRPNVTVDVFCLAYKSGNSVLLRGSSSALNSNKALLKAIKEGLKNAGENGIEDAIELCEPEADHSDVDAILTATGKIDCVLPRGGAKLIQRVVQNAKIPVIQTGAGVCHLYVDSDADFNMAAEIAFNAKTQRPGACNAIETIIVNSKAAPEFLKLMAQKFNSSDKKVKFFADQKSFTILKPLYSSTEIAQEEHFGFEYLDLVCAVKTVDNIQEAIEFINSHNTKHSEAIITNNRNNARIFQQKIDASCVYVNASTRFTDGGEFGFGSELGISTQKLHARGPMGIKALTTTKYLIDGEGQTR